MIAVFAGGHWPMQFSFHGWNIFFPAEPPVPVSGISMSISMSNVVYTKEEARHHLNTVLGHKYKRGSYYYVHSCSM